MHRFRRKSGRQAGFSLIELVVVGAAMGLLTIGFSQALISWKRNEGNLYENMEIESHRRWVRLGFDCGETMENVTGTCNASPVPLYRANGSTLIQTPSTTVGGYEFRGLCSGSTQKNFTVETRKVGTANWGPLFPVNIPRVCNEAVAGHGTILVGGYDGATLKLVKIDPQGNRDASYGTGGVYAPPAGIGIAHGMHVLPDKKILLVGAGSITRLNPDATLDTTYGTGGIKTLPAIWDRHRSFLLGNRIYIASTTGTNACIMGIEAYDLNGNPIAGFGTSGYKRLKGPAWPSCPANAAIQLVSCLPMTFVGSYNQFLQLDSTGKLLVSGTGRLMRLNSTNGALDTTFGGASTGACPGVALGMTVPGYFHDFPQPIIRSDGKLWLGRGNPGDLRSQLLSVNGVLDTTYGFMVFNVGFPPVPTTFNGIKSEPGAFPNGYLDITTLPSGFHMAWAAQVYRLNPDLTQDASYNSGTPPGYNFYYPMVATQSGHMIGWAYRPPPTQCEVSRLRLDGAHDTSFAINDHGCGMPTKMVELPP